jgi:SAM-dependent methyltransferase
MLATERLLNEQHFHDRQAEERAAYFAGRRGELVFDDSAYLDHETWIRPAFSRLSDMGDLRGKDVLDYGCGHGMASVVLARRGARVTGFDLSSGYVAEARRRAEANGVRVAFHQADAEELPFADRSFDAVWGCAILHHLDLERAGRELLRVLRPGGVAVFCEPWGENPLLNLSRRWLPYPGKERTPDERPLRRRDLQPMRAIFGRVEIDGMQFLGMLRRLWRRTPGLAGSACWLDRVDMVLLRRFHFLKNWCRYVVIELRS